MNGRNSYPSYKETSIPWLASIPIDWEVQPLFSAASEKKIKNVGMKETNLLSLSYGQITKRNINSNEGLLPESFETYQIVDQDDIVFRMTDLQNDQRSLRSALVRERGIITSAYIAVQSEGIDPSYLNYLMRAYDVQKVFYAMGGGLRQSLRFEDLRRLPLVIPSLSEQIGIVGFLNRETTRIDTLIAKKTRFIELLKEKRQAVITKAVTKGLDESVEMKDSGVEWLGAVPVHWTIASIKRIVSTPITDGPHETPVFQDDGVPFVSAEAISSGFINFEKIRGFISREDHERFSRKYVPRKGDIYMVKSGATTGITAIVEDSREFNIWSPLAAIRCNQKADPLYVLAFMRSKNFLDAISLNWSYGTQQNIGMGVLENLAIALPTLAEQTKIVAALNRITARLDVLVHKTERSIELLKEHRAALITAAVTGKIDVREAA